ncbi:MAG: hypothetical protein H6559_27775 [Lewinellaceae bacterium]|nr:hypothetical protein [Lewinellaceae bacterium]
MMPSSNGSEMHAAHQPVEMQEMLGDPPGWILHSGISLVFFGIMALLLLGWLVRYPDKLPADVLIELENPAAPLRAIAAGRIDTLFLPDKSVLKAGYRIAVLESAAHWQDIDRLSMILAGLESHRREGSLTELGLPEGLRLGNLQSSYAAFAQAVKGYCLYEQHNAHRQQINSLKKNYDFLHGALGSAMYFNERGLHSDGVREQLEEIIDWLLAFQDEWGGWLKKDTTGVVERENTEYWYYNLGLSHGIPGILSILGLAYRLKVRPQEARSAAYKGLRWLREQELQEAGSLFPYYVACDKTSPPSRLGWCYGDLGIALCLLNLSISFEDDILRDEAIRIAKHSAGRKEEAERLEVNHLCHGTAGISHIFNRFYQHTGHEVFRQAALYWLGELLRRASPADSSMPFRNIITVDYKKQTVDDFGLLEGLAGIGLMLIASLGNAEPHWDRCLLIS